MSHTFKHQKAYEQREDEDFSDNDFDGTRYGNRRQDVAKMRVKARRMERHALPDPIMEFDAAAVPPRPTKGGGLRGR